MSLQTAKYSRLAYLSRLADLSRPRTSPGSIHPVLRNPSPHAGAPARLQASAESRPSASPRRPEAATPHPVPEPRIQAAAAPVQAPVPPKPAASSMPAPQAAPSAFPSTFPSTVTSDAALSRSAYPDKGTAPTPHAPESRVVRVGMARVPVRWLTRT